LLSTSPISSKFSYSIPSYSQGSMCSPEVAYWTSDQ
jgi:hypothetical protein